MFIAGTVGLMLAPHIEIFFVPFCGVCRRASVQLFSTISSSKTLSALATLLYRPAIAMLLLYILLLFSIAPNALLEQENARMRRFLLRTCLRVFVIGSGSEKQNEANKQMIHIYC